MRQGKAHIFIISGPSGSGKTTLLEKVIRTRALKDKLTRPVSFTTRLKRSGEKEGRDYFFITEKQFREKLRAKKILEWTKYLGYYYATPKDFIEKQLKSGKHIILCVDLKGTFKIRRLYPKNTTAIFVMPPTLEALYLRIKKRCHKTGHQEIRQRLVLARKELLAAPRFDYCLVNKNLKDVAKELQGIILNKI